MTNKNQPVHCIRYGAVKAAIWANNSLSGYFYHTSFQRVYKTPEGEWGTSDSFDDRDLPSLAKAASDAHSWIYEAKSKANRREEEQDDAYPDAS